MLACSLAHSHIKSNSFIFTFIHPGRAREGLAGQEGAHRRTSLAGGRRLSGVSPVVGTLCQGVPYLVLRAPAQEFSLLVRAGQGVAAAVTTHVECGVHGVGEVGGLQGDRGFKWGSGDGICGPGALPPTSIPSSNPVSFVTPPTASCLYSGSLLSCPPGPPCQGPVQSQHPVGPLHHQAPRLHTSYRWGSQSPHSWPRWSSAGAGSP